MLGVIGVVIDGGHRSHLVEAFYEHTLGIHIRKAQGSDNLSHTFLTSPCFHSIKQGPAHLNIIDEIDPSEAYALALPLLVSPVVDDAGNTAYDLTILIRQEIFRLTEFKGSILVLAQRVHIVSKQVGRIVLIALIQVVMKIDEGRQTLLVRYLLNNY